MAFNPFVAFRRHQKTIFATMAIVCMGLFVVSSGVGGGDLLQQFGDWAGRRTGGVETVATLGGKKIDVIALRETQFNRQLANAYINMASGVGMGKIQGRILSQREKADPALQQPLRRFMNLYVQMQMQPEQLTPEMVLGTYAAILQELQMARRTIEAGTAPDKADQLRNVSDFFLLIDRQRVLFQKQMLRDRDGYFGGDLTKTEDTLDFLVWKQQADKLGVIMTDEDVGIAVQNEMLYQKPTADEVKAMDARLRQQFREYTVDRLNHALRDEFRVRTAKAALLGESTMVRTAPPMSATPDELANWYKDVRTTVRVGLIEVPVQNFVAKVTDTPTEADLKTLYDKHKTDEFDPRVERPGFKEPRKVKVDWFSAPQDAEIYTAAAKRDDVYQAIRQFGSAAITGDGTPAFALGAALLAHKAVVEAPLDELYREYVQMLPSWTSPIAFGPKSGIHDSSVTRPENFAILVGSSIASGATGAGPFGGLLAMEGRMVVRECRDRARIGATAILAGALDPAPLTIDAILSELIPQPPTEANLRSLLLERHRTALATRIMNADLQSLAAELTKRSKENDKNNLEAYINEFIHARKFSRGNSSLADRFAIVNDPGLAEPRKSFNRLFSASGNQVDPTGAQFGDYVVDGRFPGQPLRAKPELFRIQFIPNEGSTFVLWRSEDREPRAVTFDEAKPRVVEAWKFDKARGLAKADAERIATEVKGKTDVELRDFAGKVSPGGLIELPPLAVWNSRINFAGGAPGYEPAQIPQDKVRYPGGMATPIIDLRKQAVGATTVVHDYPRTNYFAAALMSKDEPSPEAFRMVYKASMQPGQMRDGLFDIFYGERQEAYRRDVLKQLREEAKLVVLKNDDNKTDATE